MKYIFIVYALFLLTFDSISLAQGNLREQIISEIESVIKPQYGEDYNVDIDFADSLLGKFSEDGLFKFEDPDNLLNGCILFGAVKYYKHSRDSSIFGIYKDGMIKWHTDPIISGLWSSIMLIRDINNDSKIDIVTDWYRIEWVDAIWIFSWDGTSGSIINDYDNDPNSIDYGKSTLNGDFNSFHFIDYEDDGILEMQCLRAGDELTFSWNGDKYGIWPNTPQVPEDYVFPANKLTIQCRANVVLYNGIFEYSYAWTNDSSSQQNIQEIALYNSSCDEIVETPWRWLGSSGGNIVPLIGWTSLIYHEQMIHPGEVKDSFIVQCSKYPKIVDYYVQGYTRAISVRSSGEYLNDLLNNSYHGYTIGPADTMDVFDPSEFLDSLLSYNQRSFELGWITNQFTVDKYDSLFNLTKTQLQQNNINAARSTLQAVLQEVDIDSINNLTSEAYALLRYNTEYLIDQIPEGSPGLPVKLINSQGSLLPGGSLKYYDAGWKDAIDNGDGTFTINTERTTVSLKMTYEYGTQQIDNVPVGSDTAVFQTVSAAVQLKDSQGNLIPSPLGDQGTIKYYAGGWRDFGTTVNGPAAKELLPKNYSFRMTYAFASNDKQQNISVDPTVVFQTVNAAVQLKDSQGNLMPAPLGDEGTVKYYAGGWQDFGTTINGVATKELLPKNYSFRMTYAFASNDKQQDIGVDPTVIFQTVNSAVQLKDSQGNLMPGPLGAEGTVKYYAGGWRDLGTTVNGTATKELLPKNYSFRMTYAFASNDKQQDISVDPTVVFQTVNAAVELRNSLGNLIDEGTVKYYAGGWRNFGTTANGVANKELLPKNYSFRMAYAFASIDKQQDLSTNSTVTFSTVLCTVNVSDTNNQPLENAEAKYYSGAWRDIGLTNVNGEITKELLPKNLSFRAIYGGVTENKQQDIGVNSFVEFILSVQ